MTTGRTLTRNLDCDGTVFLVAATGGHLMQLHELADRLPQFRNRVWITFENEQSRTLLAGERVQYVPELQERDIKGVLRMMPQVRRLFRTDGSVSAVISTGSAIALAFLPYAVMRSIPAHYIESAARTDRPSLTGRVLARVPGVRLYRQYEHRASGRWGFGGSVFDGYDSQDGTLHPIRRIVVTLGATYGFQRLVERLVGLIPPDIQVLWQVGDTPVAGLGINAHRFIPQEMLCAAMTEADVVIAHSACGSALTALKAGRCPVLVPRDPQHDRIIDNHQIELASWLNARGLAVFANLETLGSAHLERAAARVIRRTSTPAFQLAL